MLYYLAWLNEIIVEKCKRKRESDEKLKELINDCLELQYDILQYLEENQ